MGQRWPSESISNSAGGPEVKSSLHAGHRRTKLFNVSVRTSCQRIIKHSEMTKRRNRGETSFRSVLRFQDFYSKGKTFSNIKTATGRLCKWVRVKLDDISEHDGFISHSIQAWFTEHFIWKRKCRICFVLLPTVKITSIKHLCTVTYEHI